MKSHRPLLAVALALVSCGDPFEPALDAADASGGASPEGGADAAASDGAAVPDADADAPYDTQADADAEACSCEHMPLVSSGAVCGPNFSCVSVGENTCWRCPCTEPGEYFMTKCLTVGNAEGYQWWCCP
jgi:hypothetical protein